MGKKVFGALLLVIAIAIFLTIREEGVENAFGGVMAPIESVRTSAPGEPLGGLSTGNSMPGVAQTDYKRLTDRVRDKTNDAMRKSESRAGRY